MVLSATQTRPSLRWSLYVCPYIASENPLRQSDSYHLNINSDTHNMLKSSILTNPASATSEAQAYAWAFFCGGRILHVLPVARSCSASLRKRPFGPSANPASIKKSGCQVGLTAGFVFKK